MHGFINPWQKSPWYPLHLRMGGPQYWSVYFWEDRYFLPLLGTDQRFLSHSEHRLVTMVTVLVRSPYRIGKLYTLLVTDLSYIDIGNNRRKFWSGKGICKMCKNTDIGLCS